MTERETLVAGRLEAIARAGEIRVSTGESSVEYADVTKTVAFYDAQIAKLDAIESGSSRFRISFVSFSK